MSFNHENVVWQRADGRWGIGFYKRISTGDSSWDSDYDPEWDDDFDYQVFSFASTGFLTEQQAIDSWRGANPGSHDIITFNKKTAKEIAEYEDMARAANNPAYAKERIARKEKEAALALRKAVRERLRKTPPEAHGRYYVRLSKSKMLSATGIMRDMTGYLQVEGDWLGFWDEVSLKSNKTKKEFVKVWNTKTNSPAPLVLNIERAVSRRY